MVLAVCWVALLTVPVALAEEAPDIDAIVDAVGHCLVKVSVSPQYSEGKGPQDDDSYCYGRRWRGSMDADVLSNALSHDRPVEVPGFLVASDRVVIQDSPIHPRFIKRVEVAALHSEGTGRATDRERALDECAPSGRRVISRCTS